MERDATVFDVANDEMAAIGGDAYGIAILADAECKQCVVVTDGAFSAFQVAELLSAAAQDMFDRASHDAIRERIAAPPLPN